MNEKAERQKSISHSSLLTIAKKRTKRQRAALGRFVRRLRGRWTARHPKFTKGLVETFDDKQVFGWLELPHDEDARSLSLFVNEMEVASTSTAQDLERNVPFPVAQFRIRLNSLFGYLSHTDILSVRYNGRLLPIVGHGWYRSPPKTGSSTLWKLESELASGHVFNQKGKLQLSKQADQNWQHLVFSLYDRVRTLLKEELDLDLMVIYGTLLGTVRTGKFITRDHDFDVGYFSKHNTPTQVKDESERVIRLLLDKGYAVYVKYSCFYVSDAQSDGVQIDFGRLFFDEHGELQSAFGFAGTQAYLLSSFSGYETRLLQGHPILTVNNPEDLLACIYGPKWHVPNPGFSWTSDIVRAVPSARFNKERVMELRKLAGKKQSL